MIKLMLYLIIANTASAGGFMRGLSSIPFTMNQPTASQMSPQYPSNYPTSVYPQTYPQANQNYVYPQTTYQSYSFPQTNNSKINEQLIDRLTELEAQITIQQEEIKKLHAFCLKAKTAIKELQTPAKGK